MMNMLDYTTTSMAEEVPFSSILQSLFVKVSGEKYDMKYLCVTCKKYFKADKKGFSNLKKHASKNHPNELYSAEASFDTHKDTSKEDMSPVA